MAWWHPRGGSTMAQIIACCLTAPSHYMRQWWLTIKGVLWQSPGNKSTGVLKNLICNLCSEITISNSLSHLPGANYSVSPIYRGRVYRGIGYIAVACWTPFFWRPRPRYFSRNRDNTLDPKSVSLSSKFPEMYPDSWIYRDFTGCNFDLWWKQNGG